MSDPFPDWRCPRCGFVSHGSKTDWSADKDPLTDPPDLEVARSTCRFCGAPRPNLADWPPSADGSFLEAPA